MVITLPDEMVRRLEPVAAARGESVEAVALEAIDLSPLLTDDDSDGLPPLSFIGLGSGRSDLAERHNEILVERLRDVS